MLATKVEIAVMSVFGVTGAATRISPARATSPFRDTAKRVRRFFAVERSSTSRPCVAIVTQLSTACGQLYPSTACAGCRTRVGSNR